jgi:tetratricopeptide (TPR) repeat protein
MRTKQVVALFCVVLCLRLLSVSQSSPNRQQQIESHARKAAEFLKENKPELAAPEFKAIVALDPNNVDARGNLGVLLFFQGAYAEAIPQLRAALKLQPTLSKIRGLLGIAEKRTGDIEAARADLEKAFPDVQEEKIRIETGMELIEVESRAGDLDKAAAIVSELRKLEPTNEALLYTTYRIHSDLAAESLLRGVGAPRKRSSTTGPRSSSTRRSQDYILNSPICSGPCRLRRARKKPRKNTRQLWKPIRSMSSRSAGWEISLCGVPISSKLSIVSPGPSNSSRTIPKPASVWRRF